MKRRLKSLTERILLIDETLILDNQDQIYGIDFKILAIDGKSLIEAKTKTLIN